MSTADDDEPMMVAIDDHHEEHHHHHDDVVDVPGTGEEEEILADFMDQDPTKQEKIEVCACGAARFRSFRFWWAARRLFVPCNSYCRLRRQTEFDFFEIILRPRKTQRRNGGIHRCMEC
jgi:hypothetical protein